MESEQPSGADAPVADEASTESKKFREQHVYDPRGETAHVHNVGLPKRAINMELEQSLWNPNAGNMANKAAIENWPRAQLLSPQKTLPKKSVQQDETLTEEQWRKWLSTQDGQ